MRSNGCRFQIDNSNLTGESEPQVCDVNCTHPDPWETANLAFFPAMTAEGEDSDITYWSIRSKPSFTTGSGRGIVIRTGDNTCMGRIGHLAERLTRRETHISAQLTYFIHITTVMSVVLATVMFVAALCFGQNWLDAILILIGLLVAMTPEGILATVIVSGPGSILEADRGAFRLGITSAYSEEDGKEQLHSQELGFRRNTRLHNDHLLR